MPNELEDIEHVAEPVHLGRCGYHRSLKDLEQYIVVTNPPHPTPPTAPDIRLQHQDTRYTAPKIDRSGNILGCVEELGDATHRTDEEQSS